MTATSTADLPSTALAPSAFAQAVATLDEDYEAERSGSSLSREPDEPRDHGRRRLFSPSAVAIQIALALVLVIVTIGRKLDALMSNAVVLLATGLALVFVALMPRRLLPRA